MEWYYILGIIAYGIFIIQWLGSWVLGDIGLDIDFDGEIDIDGGDVFSFKGFIHFLMGFSGYLMAWDHFKLGAITVVTFMIAFIAGCILSYILYKAYKITMKLHEPTSPVELKHLVGSNAIVQYVNSDKESATASVFYKGEVYTVVIHKKDSSTELLSGQKYIITSFEEEKFYV